MHKDIKDALRLAKRRHYYDGGTVANAMMSDDPTQQAAANFARAGYSTDQINDQLAYEQGTAQTNQMPTQEGQSYQSSPQPSSASFNPVSYYTPTTGTSASQPFTGSADNSTNQATDPTHTPPLQSGQSYSWAPLYPAAGSGSNIPHAPAPPGASPISATQTPSHDWQKPYPAMGGSQWGGGQWGGGTDSGTGLKTGPSTGGRSSGRQGFETGGVANMRKYITDENYDPNSAVDSAQIIKAKMSPEEWRRHEIERLRRETQSPRSFSGPTTPKQNPMRTTPKSRDSGRSYDPRYFVAPEEYKDGTLSEGDYALARGGSAIADALRLAKRVKRNNYAVGGAPTELVAGTNPATTITNPQALQAPRPLPTGNQSYINSLYKNILGRDAEAAGQQYWMDQLNSGALNQGQVLQNFAGSQEFQNLYKTDPNKAVTALYQTALGRAPEEAGLQYWQEQAKQGLALPTMTENFINSAEGQNVSGINQAYQNVFGTLPTNEQLTKAQQQLSQGMSLSDFTNQLYDSPEANEYLVNSIYQNILGREPDTEGKQYWTDQLNKGNITPQDFQNIVEGTDEAANYQNIQFIKDEYQGLYGRDPKEEELKSILDQINKGASYDQIDQSLANTDESQQYQASNFEPYQEARAGKSAVSAGPRTGYQYSKANDALVRSLPVEQQVGALLQQEGGKWVGQVMNPNTPQDVKDQALKQLQGIVNVVANRAALGSTINSGKKGSPWAGWFKSNDPKSVTSQILAPSAFSAMKIGSAKLAKEGFAAANNAIKNFSDPAYKPISDMITQVLNNEIPDVTQGATSYKANYVNPNWARGKKGIPFISDLGGAPGKKGAYHQYYGKPEDAAAALKARGLLGKQGTGLTTIGKEQPDDQQEQPAPGGGDGGVAPQPGMSPYDPVTEQFYRDQGIGVPEQGDVILSPLTPVGGGDSYGGGKGLAPAEGGGQGAYNDTGGSFDVADSGGGYYDPIGGLIGGGWADQPSQGPSLGYSTWGPWSEDYYRYEPDMLGLKRGGRVTRGLEIAKRASGGNLVKDALRIADRKRQNDAIGSVEPMPDYMSRDNWTPERWAQARRNRIAKTPNSGATATTPRSQPSDKTPRYSIPEEDYQRGNLGADKYALANGGVAGRRGYALGGNPTDPAPGTNPATGTGASTNPYASYVSSLYNNILGRQADTAGQQYWENQLGTGATTTQAMLNNFAGSQEYQNLYKADPTKAVSGMYQAAMSRAPEQAGLQYWTGQAQNGLTANQLASQFSAAPEFQNRNAIFNSYLNYTGAAPTAEQYASAAQAIAGGKTLNDVSAQISSSPEAARNLVGSAYQEILGHSVDAPALNYWTNQLTKGTLTPNDFIKGLTTSSEGVERANERTVDNMYQEMFGRAPTPADKKDPNSIYNDSLSKMAAGTLDYDGLQKAFSSDPEAAKYQNTTMVKDIIQQLTGKEASAKDINNYLPRLTDKSLGPATLYSEIFNSPASKEYQLKNLVPKEYGPASAAEAQKSVPQDSATLQDFFGQVEKAGGLPTGVLLSSMGIESTFGLRQQNAKYPQYKGAFQMGTEERKANGVSNPWNWQQSAIGAARYMVKNAEIFKDKTGKAPTAADFYGMHLQGANGWASVVNKPDALATKSLGYQKVLDNIPADVKVDLKTLTNGQFREIFSQKFLKNLQGPDGKGLDILNLNPDGTTKGTTGTPTPDPFKPGDQTNLNNYNKAFTQYKKDLGMYWFEQQTLYNSGQSYSNGNLDWNSWAALAKKGEPKPPDPTKYGFSFNPEINSWTYPAPTSTGGNAGQGLAGQGAGGNVVGNTGIGATGGVQPLVIPGITGNADLAKSLEQRSTEQQADYLAKGQALALGLAQQGQAVAEGAIAAGRTALQNYLTQTGSAGLSYLMGFGPPPTNAYGSIIIPPSGFGPGYGGGGGSGYGSYGNVTTAGGGTSVGNGTTGLAFMNKGGAVWDKSRPKSLGKPKHLSSKQKASAKAAAKAAGRPYPNLVDNMRAAQKSHGGPLNKAMNLTRRILDE